MPYRCNDIQLELVNKPYIIGSLVLSARSWAIIKECVYITTLKELSVYCLYWFIVVTFIFKFDSMNSSNRLRHLSTLSMDSKLILVSLGCLFLMCSALRICYFLFCFFFLFVCFFLLFCFSNSVGFSVRIFRNSVVGQECFLSVGLFNWCQRDALSRLDRVDEVKPTYKFLFSEIKFPIGHLNLYIYIYIYIYI